MIIRISNKKVLHGRRTELRKNQTIHEAKLWSLIRGSSLGYKFRRQHSMGSYILDFYCAEKKLAIEIDGSQHLENKEYDNERDVYMESLGTRMPRFWNNEIDTTLDGVILEITEYLEI